MSRNSKKKRDQKKKKQKKGGASQMDQIKLMQKMQENHLDLLQNIEFILVNAYREDNTIDDVVLQKALQELMYGKNCDDSRSRSIVEQLHSVREMRSDVSDKIWIDALHVVLYSIHRHSSVSSGSRGYLKFVSDYVL